MAYLGGKQMRARMDACLPFPGQPEGLHARKLILVTVDRKGSEMNVVVK